MTTLRRGLTATALLATLPYLALKAYWMAGGRAGLIDPEFGRSAVMAVANGITLVLELCAAALAVAFVSRWGRRLPAPVVLLPMWVASGLLGAILVILPLQLVISVVGGGTGGGSPAETGARPAQPIADWVFVMVYGCFCILGVALLAGFALYARERWLRPLRWWAPLALQPAVSRVARLAALGVACAATVVAVLEAVTGPHAREGLGNTIGSTGLALAAAAGLVVLATRRPGGWPATIGLGATWLGSGALAAWGLYALVLSVVPNDLAPGGQPTWFVTLQAFKLLAGVAAVVALGRLAPGAPRQGAEEADPCAAEPEGAAGQIAAIRA